MKWGLSFLIFFLALGCTPDPTATDTTSGDRDPKVPSGVIGSRPGVQSVSGLVIDTSDPESIKLNWNNPIKYQSLDFTVLILRKACDFNSTSCAFPTPSSPGSIALYKVYEGKTNLFLDTEIQSGITYSYFVYVNFLGEFSEPQVVSGTAAAAPQSLSNLTPYNFWTNTLWRIGQKSTSLTVGTFSVSQIKEGELKGKVALGKNGAVAYLADTDNNRIVVLIKQIALSCADQGTDLLLQGCLFGTQSEPFVAVNVLGQPDQFSKKSCVEHDLDCRNILTSTDCKKASFCNWEGTNQGGVCAVRKNECMTKPTHVLVDNDKLLVSDSGNDRVLIYDKAPTRDGCDLDMSGEFLITRNCTANAVIGKKSPLDLKFPSSNYDFKKYGKRILSMPGALAIKDGSLYIADRGNHRVVRARQYSNQNIFSCRQDPVLTTSGYNFDQVTWDSLCSFDMVLGQNGFYENQTFKDIVKEKGRLGIDVLSYQGAANSLTTPYKDLLKRYFYDPSSIFFTNDGKVLVASNENFSLTTGEIRSWAQADIYDLNFLTQSSRALDLGDFSPTSGEMIVNLKSQNEITYKLTDFSEASLCSGIDCKCNGLINGTFSINNSLVQRPVGLSANILILQFDLLIKQPNPLDPTASTINNGCYLKTELLKNRTIKMYLDLEQNMTLFDLGREYLLSPSARSNFYSLYYRRIDASPIGLKGRVLVFDENSVTSSPPACDSSTFSFGNCDAKSVLGQMDFTSLPVFTEGSNLDYRNSVPYGMTSISDMAMMNNSLLITDNVTNDIYFFLDYTLSTSFNFRIENPLGAPYPLQPTKPQPNLKSLSSIVFDPLSNSFVLSDIGGGYVYQVRKP